METPDEVDRIVTAWERERPDLDPAPLQVFSRLSRLARQLELARRTAFNTHGLESGAFDVLSALRRSGEPYKLTPGKLLAETLVTSGTMTNRIDRLARAGYVERSKDASDGRVVLVVGGSADLEGAAVRRRPATGARARPGRPGCRGGTGSRPCRCARPGGRAAR